MQKNRGEIATVITIGTLIILGISSLVSSIFLKQTQTTRTKAQTIPANACTKCDGPGNTCKFHPELVAQGCTNNGCTTDGSNGIQCAGDKATNAGPTTNCIPEGGGWSEPEGIPCCNGLVRSNDGTTCVKSSSSCSGKLDITGTCNPACCTNDSDCSANGANQVCGVQNGYCKSGLSCAAPAPGQTKPLYVRVCGGANNGTCGWTFCDGKNINPKTGNVIPLTACTEDQNSGQGQICKSDDECAGPTNNVCFYLTDEIYYNQGQGFDHHVKFWSPPGGGDGHITLSRNGGSTGIVNTVWNKNQYNPYVIEPQPDPAYGAGHNLGPGTYTFEGTADTCGKIGMGHANVSCTTGINADGTAFVRGAGCTAKNFSNTPPKAVPTPTPTPKSTANIPVPNLQPQAQYSNQLAGVCAGADDPNANVWKCADGKFYTGTKCPLPGTIGTIGYSSFNDACAAWAKNQGNPTVPAQITGRCTDKRLGTILACPTTDQPNPNVKKYVNCGATGAETESCQIFCVLVIDPKQRAECYSGEFTDNRLFWGPNELTVSVINASTGTIRLKSIYIQTYGLGGTGKDKTDAVNLDLVSGQTIQRPEPGVSCSDEWTRGERDIIVAFTKQGKNTDDTIEIQAGCDSRPVVTITD